MTRARARGLWHKDHPPGQASAASPSARGAPGEPHHAGEHACLRTRPTGRAPTPRPITRISPTPGPAHWPAATCDVLAAGLPAPRSAGRPGEAVRIMGEDFTLYRGEGGGPSGGLPLRAPRHAALDRLGRGRLHPLLLPRLEVRRRRPVRRAARRGADLRTEGQDPELPGRGVPRPDLRLPRGGRPPPPPSYADMEAEGVLEVDRYVRRCNYFNNLENDPVHLARAPRLVSGGARRPGNHESEETEYGLKIVHRMGQVIETDRPDRPQRGARALSAPLCQGRRRHRDGGVAGARRRRDRT